MPVNRIISSGKGCTFHAAFEVASKLKIHYACNLESLPTAIRAAHGVLILTDGSPAMDQVEIQEIARLQEKPCLCLDIGAGADADLSDTIRAWRLKNDVKGLFLDGPTDVAFAGRLSGILMAALSRKPS